MKHFILGLLSILICMSAHAIGIERVTGAVESFDQKSVVLKLEDGRTIKVNRAAFSQGQQDSLRPGAKLTFNIDEITLTRSVIPEKSPPQAPSKKK